MLLNIYLVTDFLAVFIEQLNIVIVLIITLAIFLVLLFLGVKKSYQLKAESDFLSKKHTLKDKDSNTYKDFTSGHLYSDE